MRASVRAAVAAVPSARHYWRVFPQGGVCGLVGRRYDLIMVFSRKAASRAHRRTLVVLSAAVAAVVGACGSSDPVHTWAAKVDGAEISSADLMADLRATQDNPQFQELLAQGQSFLAVAGHMGLEKDPQRLFILGGQFADGAKGRRPFRVGGEGAMQRLGSHLVHREILAVKGVAPRAEAVGDKLVRPLLQGLPVGFDRDVFAHRLRLAVHHGLAGPGGGQQLAQRRNESLAVAAGGQESP